MLGVKKLGVSGFLALNLAIIVVVFVCRDIVGGKIPEEAWSCFITLPL
jgi:hypothetical protein